MHCILYDVIKWSSCELGVAPCVFQISAKIINEEKNIWGKFTGKKVWRKLFLSFLWVDGNTRNQFQKKKGDKQCPCTSLKDGQGIWKINVLNWWENKFMVVYSKEKESTLTRKIWSRAQGMTNCLTMMDSENLKLY